MPVKTLESEGGWIVMSHIGWGGEHTTIYKGVETSLEAQKGSYLLAVDPGRYSVTLNVYLPLRVIYLSTNSTTSKRVI